MWISSYSWLSDQGPQNVLLVWSLKTSQCCKSILNKTQTANKIILLGPIRFQKSSTYTFEYVIKHEKITNISSSANIQKKEEKTPLIQEKSWSEENEITEQKKKSFCYIKINSIFHLLCTRLEPSIHHSNTQEP